MSHFYPHDDPALEPFDPPTYPREDRCQYCGKHLGTILSEQGDALALGMCEECSEKIQADAH